MQVFFILFSVYFAVYQYINSKCLYRTHVKIIDSSEYSDYSNYFEKLPQMLAYSIKKQ